MATNRLFVNSGNIVRYNMCKTHLITSRIFKMLLDPQNMGLDTSIVELCALLAEIWQNIHFPVMASLICIKMVFCQLFNIANRFLWYFSNLETSIRKLISGGCTIPAQLFTPCYIDDNVECMISVNITE